MNIVFWGLIILAGFALWLVLMGIFRLVGNGILGTAALAKNIMIDETKKENEEDMEED